MVCKGCVNNCKCSTTKCGDNCNCNKECSCVCKAGSQDQCCANKQ